MIALAFGHFAGVMMQRQFPQQQGCWVHMPYWAYGGILSMVPI